MNESLWKRLRLKEEGSEAYQDIQEKRDRWQGIRTRISKNVS